MLGQTDETALLLESSLLSISSHGEHGQHSTPSLPSHQIVQQGSSYKDFLYCHLAPLNIDFH